MPSTLGTHDLAALIGQRPIKGAPRIVLWDRLKRDSRRDAGLLAAFEYVVAVWNSELRYSTEWIPRDKAAKFLANATVVTDWCGSQSV